MLRLPGLPVTTGSNVPMVPILSNCGLSGKSGAVHTGTDGIFSEPSRLDTGPRRADPRGRIAGRGGVLVGGTMRVLTIRGIPINVHVSWLVIYGLITWTLATGYFPRALPELPAAAHWANGLLAAFLLFLSVLLHELSHSFVRASPSRGCCGPSVPPGSCGQHGRTPWSPISYW